jgi:hypothetical protein
MGRSPNVKPFSERRPSLLRISFVWHLQGLQYQRRWDLFAQAIHGE